ncbi:MAG: EamA family transporter [Actinomycetota bacterium]
MAEGLSAAPANVVLLALLPGLLALLLYYRGLTATRASYATLAELAFPATAVVLNWAFLGVGVSANQALGFVLLWGSVLALGYLNARAPAPQLSAPALAERGR